MRQIQSRGRRNEQRNRESGDGTALLQLKWSEECKKIMDDQAERGQVPKMPGEGSQG